MFFFGGGDNFLLSFMISYFFSRVILDNPLMLLSEMGNVLIVAVTYIFVFVRLSLYTFLSDESMT